MNIIRPKNSIQGLNADLLALQNADAAEAAARAAAITSVQTLIADATAAAQAATAAEAATRAAADTALQTAIAKEATDRAAAITAAKVALGTNHTVADNAARDALPDLDVADTVTVTNGGNWIKYGIESVNAGVATFFVMSSKVEYETAQSAAAVKAAYESNANTNAFTDADKAKVGFVSITKARDLDKAIQTDELLTSPTMAGASDTNTPSALAIKTFVLEATRTGGSVFKTESVVVNADKIVLAEAPKDGLILNFATVRHIDVSGAAYDVPVSKDGTDASGKTFILAPTTPGEFDTKSVLVQYPYVMAA